MSAELVEVRPRLRLPREVAAKLDDLAVEEKSGLIIQAFAAPKLDKVMATWCPAALKSIANVLDDVAEGQLRWVPKSENEERPAYLFQTHYLSGWAGLLLEMVEKGKA